MESIGIREFLSVSSSGAEGSDYGYGGGNALSAGSASGFGYGCGIGAGVGEASCGFGTGFGSGSGGSDSSGRSNSSYFNPRSGLKTINGRRVYIVDKLETVIYSTAHGVAKGGIVNSDLTITPCWIVKQNNTFAHGETLHDAREALLEKLFEDMPEEERIAEFVRAHKDGVEYSDKDFFEWHNRLTGSCEMGRMAFAKNHGLEALDGKRTVREFIELCENDYGGSTIKKLKEFYPKEA